MFRILSRRVVLVLVAVLFIMSIPFVSADAYPIELDILPNTTMSSANYSLEEGDVFGVSVSIIGHVCIQIEYGRGQDVKTWPNVTGDFVGNITIERATSYYIDFYNLAEYTKAVVTGWIVINEFIPVNITTSTTFPFNTTTTTTDNWLPDLRWLMPPLALVSGALIIIMVSYLCRGRKENLHFLLNIEEALFGLPEETTED